jgi:hypothetical protein
MKTHRWLLKYVAIVCVAFVGTGVLTGLADKSLAWFSNSGTLYAQVLIDGDGGLREPGEPDEPREPGDPIDMWIEDPTCLDDGYIILVWESGDEYITDGHPDFPEELKALGHLIACAMDENGRDWHRCVRFEDCKDIYG